MKTCRTCGVEKALTEYPKDAGRKDGLKTLCKACNTAMALDWAKKHPERARAKCDAWIAANPERVLASKRARDAANRESIRRREKAKYAADPSQALAYNNARRARKRNAGGTYTAKDVSELMLTQKGKCVVCRTSITKKYHVDHIEPLARGGSNDRTNLQLLCPSCNSSKGAKHPIDFMQSRGFLL